jgi:hypothetical protein
MIALRGSLS